MNGFAATIGSIIARFLQGHANGPYPHPAADLAAMRSIIAPGDVVLVEGNRRISTAIKYLTQSTWPHAAIYVGERAGHDEAGRLCDMVEADTVRGVRAFPLEDLAGLHLRICRPIGLSREDATRVADYVLARLGNQYDLKNVLDLARFLLPTPPVPTPWRRRMLALGSGDPTRAICSTLIAQAFQSVGFPVLPVITVEASRMQDCQDCVEEIYHIRHYSLFVPRDFDVSAYFAVLKPSLRHVIDYKTVNWAHTDNE